MDKNIAVPSIRFHVHGYIFMFFGCLINYDCCDMYVVSDHWTGHGVAVCETQHSLCGYKEAEVFFDNLKPIQMKLRIKFSLSLLVYIYGRSVEEAIVKCYVATMVDTLTTKVTPLMPYLINSFSFTLSIANSYS